MHENARPRRGGQHTGVDARPSPPGEQDVRFRQGRGGDRPFERGEHGNDAWSDDQLSIHQLKPPPSRELSLRWPAWRTESPLVIRTRAIAIDVASDLDAFARVAPRIDGAGLVVDALLGTGGTGAPRGAVAA
ncbi:MAG: hypothetical protein ABIQ18_09360, partial [Umezawaea sp.]